VTSLSNCAERSCGTHCRGCGASRRNLEHVTAGNGIVVLPVSTSTFYTGPDVTDIHVTGIAPNQMCLVWDNARDSALVCDYAEIARAPIPIGDLSSCPAGIAAAAKSIGRHHQ
jgi:hypothetical protein